jgi:Na+/H+ antiporter NhaC
MEIGLDRLIARLIQSERVSPELLPTLAFSVSLLLSLVIGTSWGTMVILFPRRCEIDLSSSHYKIALTL